MIELSIDDAERIYEMLINHLAFEENENLMDTTSVINLYLALSKYRSEYLINLLKL